MPPSFSRSIRAIWKQRSNADLALPQVNYEAAARDYGAASSGSMRVMVGTILRKIKAAHEGTAGDSAAGGVVTTAPVMGKKRSGGKKGAGAAGKPAKRSAATAGDGDEDDEEVKNEDREVPGKKRKVADAGAEAELGESLSLLRQTGWRTVCLRSIDSMS